MFNKYNFKKLLGYGDGQSSTFNNPLMFTKRSQSKGDVNINENSTSTTIGNKIRVKYDPEKSEESLTNVSKVPDYVITAAELINNDITEIPMLIDPIIPKVGLTMLAGSSDTGKSSILRQLGLNIVGNYNSFLDFDIKAEHNSVIYVSTEDNVYALSSVLKMQNVDNIPEDLLKNFRFILDTENLIAKLDKELVRMPADCIIIDAFTDIFTKDLNASNSVRGFLNKYSDLGKKHKAAIIFLHHTGKQSDNSAPSKTNLLGSQGIEAKMRAVFELRPDFKEPEYRHLCVVKGNYLPSEFKNKSIKLLFNENLLFNIEGEGIDFFDLARNKEKELQYKDAAKQKAISLKKEGKTLSEITTILSNEGFPYSRSTYGNWTNGLNTNPSI